MRGVVVTLVVLGVLLIAPSAFSATGSVSGSVIIQPDPGSIIIVPGGPISLTQDPIVKKQTIKFFGITITYIDTTIYWTNGKLNSKSSVIEVRDSKGRLTLSTGTVRKYDWNGNLTLPINMFTNSFAYNKNGAITNETYCSYNYDAKYKLLSSDKSVISYTYTAKGELKTKTNSAYFYDNRGRKVSSSVSTWNYLYNDDGTLKQEVSIYEEKGADNKTRAYSKSVTDYYYLANGDTYQVHSSYDVNGKLCTKTADLSLAENGQSVVYHVSYDIDASGNIQYTHVRDANNVEVNTLSGSGYKEPTAVISDIRNPPQESSPFVMKVDGSLTLNSNKTWDFNKFTLEVSGDLSFDTNTNGYDIYCDGDMTLTGDEIDLSSYSLYVDGNLTVNGALTVGSIYATGDISINAGSLELGQGGSLPGGSIITGGSVIFNTSGNTTIEQSDTVTLQGDTELIDKMSVGNAIQVQQQQIPQGVAVSGTLAIKGQEVLPLKK